MFDQLPAHTRLVRGRHVQNGWSRQRLLPIALVSVMVMATSCGAIIDEVTGPVAPLPSVAPPSDSVLPPVTVIGDAAIGSTTTTDTTLSPPPVLDSAIDTTLRSFGPWSAPVHQSNDSRDLSSLPSFESDRMNVTCAVTDTRSIAPGPFTELAVFPFTGEANPGLIVDGNAVLDGDLRPIAFDRAPLTLQMDLASANPTVEVADPTSSSLTQAVATLKSDADARLTGIDVVPANIDFVLEETSSYEEALLQMGVSLRYDSPGLSASFESSFDQSETKVEHSVTMRLLQPMFTIRVDRSQISTPGDLVAPTTSMQDIDSLVADGRMGPSNPPVMIDSVTYGRSVYFTVTSTEVDNASELRVAVEGAYGSFSGDASVTDRQRSIVSSSIVRAIAYGGDQEVATSALRDGNIQGFLREVNTSSAAPLTMTLRTLDGLPVTISDEATIQDIGCTRTPIASTYEVSADVGNGWLTLIINDVEITEWAAPYTGTFDIAPYLRSNRRNEVQFHVFPSTCINANVTISILVDDIETQRRDHDAAACQWWSSWYVDVGQGTGGVTGPSNW